MSNRSERSTTEHGRHSAVKMSKGTQIALHGLCYLGSVGEDRPVQIREIIQGGGVSASYAQNIMRQLSKAGIVVTHRGVTGGYSLGRKLSHITLFDVVTCIEGPISGWAATSNKGRNKLAAGALGLIERAHNEILRFMRDVTLDQMLASLSSK